MLYESLSYFDKRKTNIPSQEISKEQSCIIQNESNEQTAVAEWSLK